MELYNNFNKKFNFKNENYQLPSPDLFYSTDAEKYEPLQIIKAILNFVKSKLNDYKIEGEQKLARNKASVINIRNLLISRMERTHEEEESSAADCFSPEELGQLRICDAGICKILRVRQLLPDGP
jgi:hypothetical protein